MKNKLSFKIVICAVFIIGIIGFIWHHRAATQKPNIILIILDASREDHLSCYGYARDTSVNTGEIEKEVRFQEKRIEKSKNSNDYAFEFIHLGHIYMEIGKYAMVKDCYLKALRLSNYTDSNTIISPIINWYLWNGQKEAVVNICTEILSHNLGNCIARSYREWLITTTFSPAN